MVFDVTSVPGNDARDVLEVDQNGNVYSTAPGGPWIISLEGKQLDCINGPKDPHNMACGDDDRQTLYVTAFIGLYRIRLNIS